MSHHEGKLKENSLAGGERCSWCRPMLLPTAAGGMQGAADPRRLLRGGSAPRAGLSRGRRNVLVINPGSPCNCLAQAAAGTGRAGVGRRTPRGEVHRGDGAVA